MRVWHAACSTDREKEPVMYKQLFAALIAVGSASACRAKATDTRDQPAPDNTARNARSREAMPTADHAVSNRSDLDVTQKIRKAVIDDTNLSLSAHNCKIVVNDGVVTLVGPVSSVAERERVEQIALAVIGPDQQVVNKLEVAN
jgi:osmotically-inducible protein OsmY